MKGLCTLNFLEPTGGLSMVFCNLSIHLSSRVPHGVPALRMLHICTSNYCKGVQLSLISTQLKHERCQEQSVFSAVLRTMVRLLKQEISLFSLPLLSARVFEVSKRVLPFLAHNETYLPQFGTSSNQKLSPLGDCLSSLEDLVHPKVHILMCPSNNLHDEHFVCT